MNYFPCDNDFCAASFKDKMIIKIKKNQAPYVINMTCAYFNPPN